MRGVWLPLWLFPSVGIPLVDGFSRLAISSYRWKPQSLWYQPQHDWDHPPPVTPDDEQTTPPHIHRSQTETLWTYVCNLSRAKKLHDMPKDIRLKPARSLVYYLAGLSHIEPKAIDHLHLALRSSMRLAAELNDYNLILNMLNVLQKYDHNIIQPVILGDALRGLYGTSVRCSKIVKIWNATNIPYGAKEVNAMLLVYQKHRRLSASLKLYREQYLRDETDECSLCIVWNTLADSIVSSNAPVHRTAGLQQDLQWNHTVLYEMAVMSPCWQWHTAMKLLDEVASFQDTNRVISHLLQLNERITRAIPQHNGRYMAHGLWKFLLPNDETMDPVTCTLLIRGMNHWKTAIPLVQLHPDNPYVLSSAIRSCGRRFDLALEHFVPSECMNTALSNAFLQTCVGRNRGMERLRVALSHVEGMECADTITWNTVLAVIVGVRNNLRERDWETLASEFPQWFGTNNENNNDTNDDVPYPDRLVHTILSRVTIADAVTYKHAVQAVDLNGLVKLLKDDIPSHCRSSELYHEALGLVSKAGNVQVFLQILSMMQRIDRICCHEDTTTFILQALGSDPRSNKDLSSIVLGTYTTSSCWALEQAAACQVNLQSCLTAFQPHHWAVAIEACLLAGDFEGARRLLRETSLQDFKPSDMERIASAYAVIALESDATKAVNAHKIISTLQEPSIGLLKQAIRACFKAELWAEARGLLRKVHQYVLDRPGEQVTRSNALGGLHRELLKECSRTGNLKVALWLCQDIQLISKELVTTKAATKVEMGSMEWKYFIATAAKSGNWKVCLSTLQHLQYPLKASNPKLQSRSPEALQNHYAKLESTLNHVVQCFAKNDQYAWILRVVDDWIDWSGRPPPLSATKTAIRYLAQPEHLSELNALISKVRSMKTSTIAMDPEVYHLLLYVSVISALYGRGLYDAADDQFVAGVTEGAIPFQLSVDDDDPGIKRITLDLHGMNVAVAHSAVRIAMQRETAYHKAHLSKPIELMIITGKGTNSKIPLRPILRPAVQRMLVEEFYPPLGSTTLPGNTGALVIAPKDISSWLDHQYQQKGVRMLLVVAMLKNLTNKVVSRVSNISDRGGG